MNRIAPRVILGILLESGQPIKRIRLMKLLFTIQQETDIRKVGAFYDFIPYRYGPYSFLADRDLRSLMRIGLVIDEKLSIPEERCIVELHLRLRQLPNCRFTI